MHLALNYKQKPYIGFVLIPEKDELWISDGVKMFGVKKKMDHKKKIFFYQKIKNSSKK